jgi:hypothetical protein
MNLKTIGASTTLDISLEEAFRLQEALADLIKQHSLNYCVGLRKSESGTGQDSVCGQAMADTVYVQTSKNGVTIPGGITLVVHKQRT